jgi:hypothetical protein
MRTRSRAILAVSLAATALVVPGVAHAATVTATSKDKRLKATLIYPGRPGVAHPKVNVNWFITVKATYNGRPHLTGKSTFYYQFFFNGTLVNTQYVNGNKKFHFTGSKRDPLNFPARSLGFKVDIHVVVVVHGSTVSLPFSIQTVQ